MASACDTLLDKTPPSATHVDDVARIGLDGKAINWIWVRLAISGQDVCGFLLFLIVSGYFISRSRERLNER